MFIDGRWAPQIGNWLIRCIFAFRVALQGFWCSCWPRVDLPLLQMQSYIPGVCHTPPGVHLLQMQTPLVHKHIAVRLCRSANSRDQRPEQLDGSASTNIVTRVKSSGLVSLKTEDCSGLPCCARCHGISIFNPSTPTGKH